MEASAAKPSGTGLLTPGIRCVIFVLGMGAVICLTVAPFKTGSLQMVRNAQRYILPITLHRWGCPHILDDVIELVTSDTSLDFLKAGGHIQVAHLSQLLLAIGIVDLGFGVGIQDFGKRDGVRLLGQHR